MKNFRCRVYDFDKNQYNYYESIFNRKPYTEKNSGFVFQYEGSNQKYHKLGEIELYVGTDIDGNPLYENDDVEFEIIKDADKNIIEKHKAKIEFCDYGFFMNNNNYKIPVDRLGLKIRKAS